MICFDYEIVHHKAVTIEDYSSLFATIRHYSPLFALFVLFAIRDYSLFAIRYSRLFAIRYSGFPDTRCSGQCSMQNKFIVEHTSTKQDLERT